MSDGVILLISNDFPPVSGGQSRYLYDLWSCLPADEVVVMAPALRGAEALDVELDCRVVRVPLCMGESRLSKVFKTLRLCTAVWSFCRSNDVRFIHCGQIFSTGFAGLLCRRLLGIPYCLYAYGADLLEFISQTGWGLILRRILYGADWVIAISNYTHQRLLDAGVDPVRVHVVNPAIDLERFALPEDRKRARKAYGWQDKCVVLSVGRLVERKGQDMVIRALNAVADEVPTVHYAIGGSGPHRQVLEQLAESEGVAERIEFLGFVDDSELASRYAAADLVAMVSREIAEEGEVEGFGIVYLEANAVGTAVLAGRSGGVEDAVVDGHSGILVDPENPAEVAAALVRLLQDDDLRRRLGAEGRSRVREKFNRQLLAKRLWEICG